MINPLAYDHLSYIAVSYALFFGVVIWFSADSAARLKRATSRLRAADPRARRP